MSKTITSDVAMLRNLLASRTSDRKVPAAVTNIREALGVTEVTHPREVAEKFLAEILAQGERDADVAEAKFGTADEIKSHEGVVTKLPEVHDPEGDDLWHLAGDIDLSAGQTLDGPLVRLRSIGV